MDVQLDRLIEKLKKEAIDEGKEKASEIIRDAEARAESIVKEAKEQAQRIVAEAEKKAAQFQSNGELALKQAARDSHLLVKRRIVELFDRVFRRQVSLVLDPAFLKEVILRLVDQWGKGAVEEVALSPQDADRLEAVLFQGVHNALKDTVTIVPNPGIAAGFRIVLKGEDVYYDFTDESIAETLKHFLNPRVKEILDRRNG